MPDVSAHTIVATITQAIAEHRLLPGTPLVELRLAEHFGVSRTVVRQALHQLAQTRLVQLRPRRGACVAAPTVQEARQILSVRRTLEVDLVRQLAASITDKQLRAWRAHLRAERAAIADGDASTRNQLLGDFHLRLAECSGNQVLTEILGGLLTRSALITLMYQSEPAARHSSEEHEAILDALAARDAEAAARLMADHLEHVISGLSFERPRRSADLSLALG
ncbi:GntR family transcriptional regulator [Tepidimonas taiwanensis]|uniref:HTH-type transcriptional repressor RspR n=1 Tax=Tepidimonas taiwanensis TaxID=307486 RepID=A0A554X3W1_9BURK|nr:GntR family transcriptional regulator [Tepidimonas taiwanensis]TSE30493.1 HTH-type transcriptional repressor RspR [Tepidimonas taiwanensis]UBQ06357.1 GntR family transcriptional regulator [Tepidimonas taiwanensis]